MTTRIGSTAASIGSARASDDRGRDLLDRAQRRRRPGRRAAHLEDVPFSAASGLVVLIARGDRLRSMPDLRFTVRLVAIDGELRRVIAEYHLDHRA